MVIAYMDSCSSSHVFLVPLRLNYSCFSALSYSAAGICIIILPFIAMLSMIAISSLNDQYGFRSFFTSALDDGQPQSASSDSMLMCLSYSSTSLIFSAVMQSHISVCNSFAVMAIHIPEISSSLSHC